MFSFSPESIFILENKPDSFQDWKRLEMDLSLLLTLTAFAARVGAGRLQFFIIYVPGAKNYNSLYVPGAKNHNALYVPGAKNQSNVYSHRSF